MLTQNEWTFIDFITSLDIVPGLSETGYALNILAPNTVAALPNRISKTLLASYGRLIGGIRFQSNFLAQNGILFYDTGVEQLAIGIDLFTGFISVYLGLFTTKIQTSTTPISIGTVHVLEWDITFGLHGAGGYTLYLDGVELMSFVGTTISTANASANGIAPVSYNVQNVGSSFVIDDFYLFDDTTLFNNAVLLSNPRVETQFPVADHQTQFTNIGNIIGVAFSTIPGSTNAPGANKLFLRQFTPNVNCTLNSVAFIPEATNGGANFKAVVYSDSTSVPGSLLSSGPQTIGTVAGAPFTANLTTPQNLTAATPYWIGFITDTSVLMAEQDTSTKGTVANNTYASGAPGTAPSMTLNQPSWVLWGNCTGATTNWESEAVNPPPGDISSIQSGVAGTEDLYGFAALSVDVVDVYTIAVKGHAKLATPGARTLSLPTKSSSTTGLGSNPSLSPNTAYGWFGSYFDVDPNTSTTWTPTAVSNSFSGPKVAT